MDSGRWQWTAKNLTRISLIAADVPNVIFKINLFFIALLSRLFSSCAKLLLLSVRGARASHYAGFSCFRVRALGGAGSVVLAHRLSCSAHVGSSWTRDGTHVLCIGRWALNHWTSREILQLIILLLFHPGNITDWSWSGLTCIPGRILPLLSTEHHSELLSKGSHSNVSIEVILLVIGAEWWREY